MERLPSKFSPPPACTLTLFFPSQSTPPPPSRRRQSGRAQPRFPGSWDWPLPCVNPQTLHHRIRNPRSPPRWREEEEEEEGRTRYNDGGRCCAVFLARQVDMRLTCANVGCLCRCLAWLGGGKKGVKAWRTRETHRVCAFLRFSDDYFERLVSGKVLS